MKHMDTNRKENGQTKTTSYPKILPPTLMLVAVVLMIAANFLFPMAVIIPDFWRFAGLLPLAFGLAMSYLSEKQFVQKDTTVHPFKESICLVTDGLYRISRNPMYLGMALALVGVGFLLGSLAPFGVVVFFVVWVDTQFIRREEKMLFTQFGQDWLEYKGQVRRWI